MFLKFETANGDNIAYNSEFIISIQPCIGEDMSSIKVNTPNGISSYAVKGNYNELVDTLNGKVKEEEVVTQSSKSMIDIDKELDAEVEEETKTESNVTSNVTSKVAPKPVGRPSTKAVRGSK